MKFSLDNLVGLSSSIQKDLLINRGIKEEDIDVFLNKSRIDINLQESPYRLTNIERGAKFLDSALSQGKKKVMIIVDSDVDGYTSAAIIWLYIKRVYFNTELNFYIHENKEVGIPNGEAFEQMFNYDIIITPDAGSSQYIKHRKLKEQGIDVLVLDHHESIKESEDAIVINNQLSNNYNNKELSGAGVVYKFCQVLDEMHKATYAESLIDLVALGIAADNVDMRNRDNIVIVRRGVNLMNDDRNGNLFIKSLIKKKSYSLGDQVFPIDLMFYIAPLINAMVRIGTMEEKTLMFKAFILGGNKIEGSGLKTKGKMVFIEDEVARICTNVKRHQRQEETRGMEKISHLVEDIYQNDKVLVIDATNTINRSMTGLVANKIQDKYNKPTLILLQSDDGLYYGSGRCPADTKLADFRKYLNNTGLVEYAEGYIA